MKKGLFITFEGADGCGKTTQLRLLAEYLKNKGLDVVTTLEPGGQYVCEKIRELVLLYKGEVSPNCEAFLYLASRAQNVDVVVKPAVNAGKIVLCDRHIDSTIAYQGYGRKIDIEQLKMLNNLATSEFKPDLTLLFDIDVETSQARVGKEKDRLESAGTDFHERVRQGYLEIAKEEPERIKVIDSKDTIENIFEQVKAIINKVI